MISTTVRKAVCFAALGGVSLALSGCLGPTYGTGKSQGQTFFDDLNNIIPLGGSDSQEIAYTPRPELVKPDNTKVLPPPQQARTGASDPNWPESPEQRSARLRASAYQGDGELPASFTTARKEGIGADYLNRQTNTGAPKLDNDNASTTLTPEQLRSKSALIKERIAQQKQGDPTVRRYLSEPPLAYRVPAKTAPVGEPGVDEEVKERRLKNDKDTLASKLKSLWPF